MSSTSEWFPETVIRRRLWTLAKFKRTDIKLGLSMRQLIPNLIAAHVNNWYDGKPPTNSEGVRIIEWPPLLKFVCRLHPDIWSSDTPVEVPAAEARRRGPKPGTVDRYGKADRALFSEMERLIALPQYGSAYAAALHLASEGKVEGTGTATEESRARRLLAAYKTSLKLAETR